MEACRAKAGGKPDAEGGGRHGEEISIAGSMPVVMHFFYNSEKYLKDIKKKRMKGYRITFEVYATVSLWSRFHRNSKMTA